MNIEQRSTEWHQQRCGKITASRFSDCLAFTKGSKNVPPKPLEARNKYARELAFEITSGNPVHMVSSKSMAWGTEAEVLAREAYELETGAIVTESGFVLHPDYPYIGASPDGLIGKDGGLEIKSPHDEAVHIRTWLEGIPEEHIAQVQGNLFVTGRQWWDFVSFDPRQAAPYRLYIQRIPRDEDYIEKLRIGLLAFWTDVQKIVSELKQKAA